jgi:hypothetical protein
VNYAFNPRLVLKAERHQFKGYGVDAFVNPFGPAPKTPYTIISLAAAF